MDWFNGKKLINATNQKYWILGLLVLLFVLPMLVAYGLVQRPTVHRSVATGHLLNPPIHLAEFPHYPAQPNWQLIYIDNTEAPSELLKKIHAAIGKESYRVTYQTLASKKLPLLTEGDIGIVDPKGWLVLYYSPDADPKGIAKDLRRLLRINHG